MVQKRLRTVGKFLPTPKFSHWETLRLPALPHGRYNNRQQANFGTCYVVARAYSLEQQLGGFTLGFVMHLVCYRIIINHQHHIRNLVKEKPIVKKLYYYYSPKNQNYMYI